MSRAQMIEKVWIMVHDFAIQFGDELAGLDGDDNEEANEDARDILDPFAEGLLDAILPQVTTVEELEALPAATLFASERGSALQKSGTGSLVHLFSGRRWDCASAIGQFGPLTVVWQP